MSTRLLLIRHGQSVWNAARRWQGHSDAPLSDLGHAQAREAAVALSQEPLSALYASDLKRAFVTARIVGEPHGLVPVADPRLRELDVGEWGGLTRSQVEAHSPGLLEVFDSGDPDSRPPGGETRRELEGRVRTALDEWMPRHDGETVAVVAHGGVLAALTGVFGHGNAEVVTLSWPWPPPVGWEKRKG